MEQLKVEEPHEVARLIALRTLKAIPRRTVAVLAVSTFAMLVVLWLFHVPPLMLLLLFLAVFLLPVAHGLGELAIRAFYPHVWLIDDSGIRVEGGDRRSCRWPMLTAWSEERLSPGPEISIFAIWSRSGKRLASIGLRSGPAAEALRQMLQCHLPEKSAEEEISAASDSY